ncbi:hypothetical protein [Chondromyces crocatus]|uniref:Uncharacterized protein n=1 Tax=Chondromyces crocatus TaxID=52 RepID=A0A0K1EIZ3_CHOCO|nr:hypothetical protein [Chondromyces crocatus]AKT40835.1 uncharacterized protein CMC5_049900 [Chondromyces crocatus]
MEANPSRNRLRRFAPLLLAAGLFVSLSPLLQNAPSERQVELRLRDPSTIIGLETSWSEGTDADLGLPVQGSSWRFTRGQAPASLRNSVRLPDGTYTLEVTVIRDEDRDMTRRAITLGDAESITVSIH